MLFLRKVCEKLLGRDSERVGQFHNVLQTNVPLASLHASDVVSVQAGTFSEFLLGKSPFLTDSPQYIAEAGLNGTRGHPPML